MTDLATEPETPAALSDASRAKLRRAAMLLAIAAGLVFIDWAVPYVGFRFSPLSLSWFFWIQPWLQVAAVILEAIAIIPLVKPAIDPAMELLPSRHRQTALIAMLIRWGSLVLIFAHMQFGATVGRAGEALLYAIHLAASGVGIIAVMLCARHLAERSRADAFVNFTPLPIIAAGAYFGYELVKLALTFTENPYGPRGALDVLRFAQPLHGFTAIMLWTRFHKLVTSSRDEAMAADSTP